MGIYLIKSGETRSARDEKQSRVRKYNCAPATMARRPAFLAKVSSLNRYTGKRHCPENGDRSRRCPRTGGIRESLKMDVARGRRCI